MFGHTNLSGFIPGSGRVEVSNMCKLKQNMSKHFFVCDISDRTPMGHSLFLHILLQYYCSEHDLINVCVVAETVVIINIGMNPKRCNNSINAVLCLL